MAKQLNWTIPTENMTTTTTTTTATTNLDDWLVKHSKFQLNLEPSNWETLKPYVRYSLAQLNIGYPSDQSVNSLLLGHYRKYSTFNWEINRGRGYFRYTKVNIYPPSAPGYPVLVINCSLHHSETQIVAKTFLPQTTWSDGSWSLADGPLISFLYVSVCIQDSSCTILAISPNLTFIRCQYWWPYLYLVDMCQMGYVMNYDGGC